MISVRASVRRSWIALVVIVVVSSATLTGTAGATTVGGHSSSVSVPDESSPGSAATLVVDGESDGDDEYARIQAALDAATDGDVVEVRAGTYREQLVVDENVTLTALGSVELNSSDWVRDKVGIEIVGSAEPVVEGLTVVEYETGLRAENTSGAWTVRNATIQGDTGVEAAGSTGSWTIEGSTVRADYTAVEAIDSTGNWTIRDSTVEIFEGSQWSDVLVDAFNSSGSWTVSNTTVRGYSARYVKGVAASWSSGSWTVANSTIRGVHYAGVDGGSSTGNWTVRDSILAGNRHGVAAWESNGSWTVSNVTIRDNDMVGVAAPRSTGAWTIRNSTIRNNSWGGVGADNSTGDWSIRDSTVGNGSFNGVSATRSTGDWLLSNVSVTGSRTGVLAFDARGAWAIRGSTITGNYDGINAYNASGGWRVTESSIADNRGTGLVARGPATDGTAVRNWWGHTSGPDGAYLGLGDTLAGRVPVNPFYVNPALTRTRAYATARSRTAQNTHVVEPDGSNDPTPIQTALDRASPGDTIRVEAGTYREAVRIGVNVTIVAPNATIDSPIERPHPFFTLDWIGLAGITVLPGHLSPTVEGVTVRDAYRGFDASNGDGDWTLSGVTIRNTETAVDAENTDGSWTIRDAWIGGGGGVDASGSGGDWTIRRTVFSGPGYGGLAASNSTGSWTVADTVFLNGTEVGASGSSGNWTVDDVTVLDPRVGVFASETNGSWTVRNTTVRNSSGAGVLADESTGDWTVRNTTVHNSSGPGLSAVETTGDWAVAGLLVRDSETGIDARNTSGTWEVTASSLVALDNASVLATNATVEGSATRVWWGDPDGPAEDDCLGNVDCSNHRTAPPHNLRGAGVHGSGVRWGVFATVAGPDRAVSRSDVIAMVRAYARGTTIDGVELRRVDVLRLVRYYVAGP